MVERYIARLKMTNDDVPYWSSKFPGISISWLDWLKKDEVVAEFIASDVQIEPEYRYTFDQIRHKVLTTFRGRVVEDDLKTYYKSPTRALTIWSFINNPLLTGSGASREVKQAAEAATDLRPIELSKQQVDAFEKQTKQHLEPTEVRQKEIESVTQTPDGKTVRIKERTEDVFVFTQGIIDSG